MRVVEGILLIAILGLCYFTTKSDLNIGIIYNRTLLRFAAGTVVLDVIYYGFFAQDLVTEFLGNFAVVTVVSLLLFYTHSLAGGDCKLLILLAAMYPARFYLVYNDSAITLVFSLLIAILLGYAYLLINSIWKLIRKKNPLIFGYVKGFLFGFFHSYIAAMIYVSMANILLALAYLKGIKIPDWVAYVVCMVVAICVGRFPLLKKKRFLIPMLLLVIAGSIWLWCFPISVNPENYGLAFILMLFQMAIRTNLYETIKVADLKAGMILSTAVSLMMQRSITKGLPGVSTEDLKSRLTNEEIASIQLWAHAVHIEELTIVKKMPFAIFIALGYITYYILWGAIE